MSCFQWNYKARDFKFLIKLRMMKQLMWGRSSSGMHDMLSTKPDSLDPVLQAHWLQPQGETAKTLLFLFVDLYLSIVARLAEASEQNKQIGLPPDLK
jgi:hypothetical protein